MDINVYLICILLSVISCGGVFFYQDLQAKSLSFPLVFHLLLVVLIFELYAHYLMEFLKLPNVLIYNIFFIYVETLLLLVYFDRLMTARARRMIRMSMVFLVLFGICNSLFYQRIDDRFQNFSFALAVFLILSCCISFFYDIFRLNRYQNVNLLTVPEFWITTSIFFFYSSTFVYFVPIRLFESMDMLLVDLLGSINRVLAALMYIIMGLAFYAPWIFKNKRYE